MHLPLVHGLGKTMDSRVLVPTALTRHLLDEKRAVTNTYGGLQDDDGFPMWHGSSKRSFE